MTSPTPSARHISSKRINHERDPLLRTKDSDNSQSSSELGAPPSRDIIAAYKDSAMEASASIDYVSPLPKLGLNRESSEYVPTTRDHDIKWKVLLPYYLPILSWAKEYCVEFALGDLIGGVSLATFQIPLAISYASSLAKVPITCGLYSLGFAPLVYMVLGSVPQMIVGPEAPISLIVGQAVEPLLHHSKKKHIGPVDYVVAITFVSGATLLGFGLGRFGFLDNVLCESLLKGFICGVGVVMIINSSITMLGLNLLLDKISAEDSHIHSPFDKMKFLFKNFHEYHSLTLRVSMVSLITVLFVRRLKSKAALSKNPKLRLAVYVPEILLLVITTTLMTEFFKWNHSGLEVIRHMDDIEDSFTMYNPLSTSRLGLIKSLSTSGFVCAMLGFFESTTALKSLGSRYDLPISSNRELVALGAINVFGSVFGCLPAFGGYGRSKINALSAKTTTSGAIMGLISLATASSILGYLHYIPKCILSVITAIIGILLISETPAELLFHWRGQGFDELITFAITVTTTVFSSMEAGIAMGLVYLLIRVIKNSTVSHIQILGRVPGTNTFLDADLADCVSVSNEQSSSQTPTSSVSHVRPSYTGVFSQEKRLSQLNPFIDNNFRQLNYQALEEVEGCLIIRIPEPLTFTNASDLKVRLKRVEMFGSTRAHPAQKRSRDSSMTKYIIFDLEGMSQIDSSAARILVTLLETYERRHIRCFFVHVNKSPRLRARLMATGITDMLFDNLRSINYESFMRPREVHLETSQGTSDGYASDSSEARSTQYLPYFDHIRDALELIDAYELQQSPNEDV